MVKVFCYRHFTVLFQYTSNLIKYISTSQFQLLLLSETDFGTCVHECSLLLSRGSCSCHMTRGAPPPHLGSLQDATPTRWQRPPLESSPVYGGHHTHISGQTAHGPGSLCVFPSLPDTSGSHPQLPYHAEIATFMSVMILINFDLSQANY